MSKKKNGFTLIELMIVVAIIGILAVVGTPVYTNYLIRAQISEGLNISSGAKVAMSEYYIENGEWPKNNRAAGLADKHDIQGEYTEHVSIKTNVIEIKYHDSANRAIAKQKVDLIAVDNDGSIAWTCVSSGKIKAKHLL